MRLGRPPIHLLVFACIVTAALGIARYLTFWTAGAFAQRSAVSFAAVPMFLAALLLPLALAVAREWVPNSRPNTMLLAVGAISLGGIGIGLSLWWSAYAIVGALCWRETSWPRPMRVAWPRNPMIYVLAGILGVASAADDSDGLGTFVTSIPNSLLCAVTGVWFAHACVAFANTYLVGVTVSAPELAADAGVSGAS